MLWVTNLINVLGDTFISYDWLALLYVKLSTDRFILLTVTEIEIQVCADLKNIGECIRSSEGEH